MHSDVLSTDTPDVPKLPSPSVVHWFSDTRPPDPLELEPLVSWLHSHNLFLSQSQRFFEVFLQSVHFVLGLIDSHDNLLISLTGGKESLLVVDLIEFCLYLRSSSLSARQKSYTLFSLAGPGTSFPEISEMILETVPRRYDTTVLFVDEPSFVAGLTRLKSLYPAHEVVCLGIRSDDPSGPNFPSLLSPTSREGWPSFQLACPVLRWTYGDIWTYLRELNIPYPSLYDRGYTSIGSVEDTVPNPLLRVRGGGNGDVEEFRPAYLLEEKNWSKEREGRIRRVVIEDEMSDEDCY